jgi:RNA polymerase sigma factor (sigma-70 family)
LDKTEGQLVRNAQRGDQASFVELIRRATPRVFSAAQAILNNVHDSEDAVQDGTVVAFKRIRTLRDPNVFGSWFLRIVVNKAKDLRRSRRTTTQPLEDINEPAVEFDASLQLDLTDAIERLPLRIKVPAVLYFAGLSTPEIAEALDRPVGTVRRHLSEAYASLRDYLEHGETSD